MNSFYLFIADPTFLNNRSCSDRALRDILQNGIVSGDVKLQTKMKKPIIYPKIVIENCFEKVHFWVINKLLEPFLCYTFIGYCNLKMVKDLFRKTLPTKGRRQDNIFLKKKKPYLHCL